MCRTLLEKQGRSHKRCTPMDPHLWSVKARWPARTYIQQLCEDTGCGQRRWTIGRSGERGLGISVLAAHDDDDDDDETFLYSLNDTMKGNGIASKDYVGIYSHFYRLLSLVWLFFLFVFFCISTIVGNLMLNQVYTYIFYIYVCGLSVGHGYLSMAVFILICRSHSYRWSAVVQWWNWRCW